MPYPSVTSSSPPTARMKASTPKPANPVHRALLLYTGSTSTLLRDHALKATRSPIIPGMMNNAYCIKSRTSLDDTGCYLHHSVDKREPEPAVQGWLTQHLPDSEQWRHGEAILVELQLDDSVEELLHRGYGSGGVHLFVSGREDDRVMALHLLDELSPVT